MARPGYRADPPGSRRTIALDDTLTLIFHRPSTTTHVVAPPVPEILDVLAEGPADVAAILSRLAAAHELVADEGAAAQIAARLEELVAAGLVVRA